MAKYKVGDIFINHKDGKILQVCEGGCHEGCCYDNGCCERPFLEDATCTFLIGLCCHFKELPSLPPGTKVKVREDLTLWEEYNDLSYIPGMGKFKEVTILGKYKATDYYSVRETDDYIFSLEMFDQVINEPKENNMETKEIKIDVPEGYEIDKENSTFECIKFKPVKKELTYEDVTEELFGDDICFFINRRGEIIFTEQLAAKEDKNNATTKKQLERLLALNQLLNIAEYYNKKSPKEGEKIYCIDFEKSSSEYFVQEDICPTIVCGLIPTFNNHADAKAVVKNPNFKEILDLVYKGDED